MQNDKEKFIEYCNANYLTELEIRRRIPRGWNIGDVLTQIDRLRYNGRVETRLLNQDGNSFWFCNAARIQDAAMYVDRYGIDTLFENVSEKAQERLKDKALVDEAFYSSLIEGSATTRLRAEKIIRRGESPKNKGEQETLNNYRAMEFIINSQEEKITTTLIKELHKIVTHDALDHGTPGEFRTASDATVVGDLMKVVHTPPAADALTAFMDDFLSWINDVSYGGMYGIHPLVKASIIHFYFVYLHPFPDGNGRIARALYYFYLNKHYNAMPYLSISHVISKRRKKYDKAILDVENSKTDLTYFVHHSCEITREAIDDLRSMVDRYTVAENLKEIVGENEMRLNKRQTSVLKYFARKDVKHVDLKWYQKKFKVVYETARKDMMDLEKMQIVEGEKIGKKFIYKLKEEGIHGREEKTNSAGD